VTRSEWPRCKDPFVDRPASIWMEPNDSSRFSSGGALQVGNETFELIDIVLKCGRFANFSAA